jgi:polysaccharide chain length determinant protein (PEP-CTERM system associated)
VEYFKQKLDESEEGIIRFRQEQGIYMALNDKEVIGEIKKYNQELEELNLREKEVLARMTNLKAIVSGKTTSSSSTTLLTNSMTREDLINAREQRLLELSVSYTEDYPEIVKLKSEVEALRSRKDMPSSEGRPKHTRQEMISSDELLVGIQHEIINDEAEYSAIQARKENLLSLIKEREDTLRFLPVGRKKLNDLEKEQQSYKEIYDKLLFRLGQSEVSVQMEIEDKATTFRIIEPAVVPIRPESPDRATIILVGMLLGIAGGIAGAIVRDSLDSSVKDLRTLKEYGIEVIAVIPMIKSEEIQRESKKRDKLFYSLAGLYLSHILILLSLELMGFSYVYDMFSGVELKNLFSGTLNKLL